jgi:hypothetical protein
MSSETFINTGFTIAFWVSRVILGSFYTLTAMFISCKKNKSGSTRVQIVYKTSGKYVLYQTVGSSADAFEIDLKIAMGKR